MSKNHPFHMVEKSPWPLMASISALMLTSSLIVMFTKNSFNLLIVATAILMLSSYQWWRDVSRESTMQGHHSKKVIISMQMGMILFITSEILFFFGFFWAYFHSSLNPTMEIGNSWPPTSITSFDMMHIPLLNTSILLASGVTVTWSHHSILENNHQEAKMSLMITVVMGLYFTLLQMMEYIEAPFSIADSVYGSTFFLATGFHGFHVIIGTTFLSVCLIRLYKGHFSSMHHIGLESSIWYWHFVDVVWLFLYISIYWWGA